MHKEIVAFVTSNPNKHTFSEVAEKFGVTYDSVCSLLRRNGICHLITKEKTGQKSKPKVVPPAQTHTTNYIPEPPNTEVVLVVGDLHEPFTLDGYREFCIEMFNKWKCTHVIFGGDVIDNHFASFHTPDPDGFGGGNELDLAIEKLQPWIEAFPRADVIIGNHDRIIMRKAFEGGIPARWIRNYQDVLNAPGWDFAEEKTYDGVHYIHGEGPTARTRCKRDLMSTVQGHRHTEAYAEYTVGQTYCIFGMQVGCGVDRKSYAMAYAKNFPKPAISVGIVANHGKLAVVEMMPLH